jgi:ABC-type lipoprotein release transport system permease subunit
MFFTYLRRELRRRLRQAVFIALGLALGVGLVITVTAASAGVKNAQGTVLHALYGVGTSLTVTKTPTAGSFTPGSFGFGFRSGTKSRPAAGTKISTSTLAGGATLASISSSSVSTVTGLGSVAAAAGGLTLTDRTLSGTVPAINFNGGGAGGGGGGGGGGSAGSGGSGSSGGGGQSFRASFSTSSFGVDGVDIATGELGPLSSGKLSSGRTFTAADASADVAVVDSSYATQNKLKTGSAIAIGNSKGTSTNFTVIGIVSEPAGNNPSDVYIPLGVAQNLAGLKNEVNTIYVAASSASAIGSVQGEIKKALPSETVTTSADLASEVTGSLSSASSLANNLGKWLALAVLVAAFLLASLLTMAAVARRVREFGTLKALGWKSRRIIGQVMGETIALGIGGGIVGIGLGFAGAELVSKLSPKLSAVVGQTTGSATPGGARQFGFGGGGTGGGTGAGGTGGAGGGGFGGGGFGGGGGFARAANPANHTVAVHLAASVSASMIVLAVVLAIAGGIIAGIFGGWRAARLRPAAALAKVA